MLDWIRQNAESSTPATKKEINDYCTSQFQAPVTRDRVNSLVLRSPDKIIQTEITCQEEQCQQVPRVFLERTVADRNEHVQGCTAELVFNLNEVDISDWEDRKTKNLWYT
jgi:hypothetical protein